MSLPHAIFIPEFDLYIAHEKLHDHCLLVICGCHRSYLPKRWSSSTPPRLSSSSAVTTTMHDLLPKKICSLLLLIPKILRDLHVHQFFLVNIGAYCDYTSSPKNFRSLANTFSHFKFFKQLLHSELSTVS